MYSKNNYRKKSLGGNISPLGPGRVNETYEIDFMYQKDDTRTLYL